MGVQSIGAVTQQVQQPEAQVQTQAQVQDVQSQVPQPQMKPQYEPVQTAEGTRAISEEAIQKQIDNLNRLLTAKNTNVFLEYDNLSSPKMVSIVDNETGKVIKEMPPQAAVEIAEKARDYLIGLLVDKSI